MARAGCSLGLDAQAMDHLGPFDGFGADEGLGVGLVNPYATDGYASRGVVFRPFSAAVHFRTLLIYRPDLPKSRIVRDFAACLLSARNARADSLGK